MELPVLIQTLSSLASILLRMGEVCFNYNRMTPVDYGLVSTSFTQRLETLPLFEFITKEGHLSPQCFSIDTTGIVWVGTNGEGLFQMDTRTSGKFTAYNPGGLIPKFILEIYQADGYLWLAGEGLHRINPRTNQVVAYHYEVSTTYRDRLGNLWVGASNGVSKAALNSSPFI